MISSRLVNGVNKLAKRFTQTLTSTVDPIQDRLMNETCILTDDNDKAIGYATKRDCHKISKENDLPLHRAFSVLLFNTKNEILIQQRAPTKITFPLCFSNTCCSHPLYEIDGEREEKNAIGVKLAAQRRLNIELGIPPEEASVDFMHYVTRVHYKSYGDGVWGEHEIDYILIMKRDVSLNPNPNEVCDLQYVSQHKLKSFLNNTKAPLSPWFNYLVHSDLLNNWWNHLDNLDEITDRDTIHRGHVVQ